MRRVIAAGTGLLAAAALVLTGCSTEGGGPTDGRPSVVTSTNVWGSVASAVAGDDADVTSLFTDSTGDPHEFEPSAADSATVADASVIVMNGGHYDAYMERAAQNSSATVVNASDLGNGHSHGNGDDQADGHGDGDTHDHGDPATNEHVFYNLSVVGAVATEIGNALAEKDAAHAATYRENAQRFNTELAGLRQQLAAINTAHHGTQVAQTEPLATHLLTEAGLVDVAPAGFTAAVEEGQSPSAADRAAMQDLLTSRTAKALIYNTQAVDPVTEALLAVAQRANVPVVRFTETLPDGITGYIPWQRAQIESLASALNAAPSS